METLQIKKYTISYYIGGWNDVVSLEGTVSYPSKFGETIYNKFSCYVHDWVKYQYPEEIPAYINRKILSLYKKLVDKDKQYYILVYYKYGNGNPYYRDGHKIMDSQWIYSYRAYNFRTKEEAERALKTRFFEDYLQYVISAKITTDIKLIQKHTETDIDKCEYSYYTFLPDNTLVNINEKTGLSCLMGKYE